MAQKQRLFLNVLAAILLAHVNHLGDTPKLTDLIGVVKVMLDAYSEGTIDALYLCTNKFVNTMTQKPTCCNNYCPCPPAEAMVQRTSLGLYL